MHTLSVLVEHSLVIQACTGQQFGWKPFPTLPMTHFGDFRITNCISKIKQSKHKAELEPSLKIIDHWVISDTASQTTGRVYQIFTVHSMKTRLLWQVYFRQAPTNFDNFLANSIGRLSKMMCIFNFPCLSLYSLYLFFSSSDGNDAKGNAISDGFHGCFKARLH